MTTEPLRVLIAGGGVAALEALLALRALAEDRVAIELLAPDEEFTYRPLAVAEPFGFGPPFRAQLAPIAIEHGARFRRGALASVNSSERVVTTRSGERLEYDVLLVACGARMRSGLPGAITFMGAAGRERVADLVERLEAGSDEEVAFANPDIVGWPLPLYEVALLTASALSRPARAALTVVTVEREPLELFGDAAPTVIRDLFEERGIGLITGTRASKFAAGHLELSPSGRLAADAVVSLPRLEGPAIEGLPATKAGFIPVDRFGRVRNVERVYAAGDATDLPVKQGGIATQQADIAAEAIAGLAGAPVEPRPRPLVLRGLLMTGGEPRFLRAEVGAEGVQGSTSARDALWWPPSKIAGRYLAPYLASLAGTEAPGAPPEGRELHEIRVEIDPES